MSDDNQHLADQPAPDKPVMVERRISKTDRRQNSDRRSHEERRCDRRLTPTSRNKTFRTWLRSLLNSRLGVDRRKQTDRRSNRDRRQHWTKSILTKEELSDLLSE